MLVQVLGTVQVLRAGGPASRGPEVVPVARPARRRLLSLLAVHGGECVPIDRVVEEFWVSGPPARARATLHTHVSGLRRALGPDLVRTEGDGYRLDLAEHDLDTTAFDTGAREALARAEAGAWAGAVESAEAALGWWRGDPYVELPDHHDAVVETARLSELRRTLRQVRAEGLLVAGRTAEAVAELEQLVLDHPLHEQLWEHLMSGRIELGHHAAALQVYHRARAALVDLGLDAGPTLRRLQTTALRRQDESRRPPCGLPTSLTRFLGRGPELAELGSRLDRHRLVTLTGMGGVGKTRTAVEAARRQRDRFPGGTWFVPLADVGEGEPVEHAVAGSLGVRASGDLATALRHHLVGGPALVVLDNCEHLRDAVSSVVHTLLLSCPGVHVLATSREPLKIEGERVHHLPPMAVPPPGAPLETLIGYDAVRLFLERAQITGPEEREPEVVQAVAEVCRRLDGIPLALGLAAAEVPGLGLTGVLDRLAGGLPGQSLPAPTDGSRHRTLDAVVDWSYATLDETERTVLRRLAVFRGSFAPDAAEVVSSGGDVAARDVLPVLGRLVEKSLLTRSGLATVRYRLLEVVRQHADRRLRASGEHPAVARRHARWYADLAERMWRGVHDRSARPAETSPLFEMPNLRQARQHLRAGGHRGRDLALLSGAIAHGASLAGLVTEAVHETQRALEDGGDWPEWEVELRNRLSYLLGLLGDDEGARAQTSRACEVASTLPPSGVTAWTHGHLGQLELRLGSPDDARALRLAREALDIARASRDRLATIRCRGRLGHTLAWVGRGDEGLAELRAALAAARRADDPVTEIELSEALFQALLLTRGQRRHGPGALAGELHARFLSPPSSLTHQLPLPSLVHAFLQSGRWEHADEVVALLEDRHHEGDDHVATVLARAATCWAQGRYDDAAATLRGLAGASVSPHWFDRYYPLRVEVTADAGDLDEAARVAEEYLHLDVGAAHQAGKLGAVSALVRVAATAASREPPLAHEHAHRARAALALGETLLERCPPSYDGSLAMETPATHLVLARAELTRLTGADPQAWELARERADHVRFRLYAGWRLAEAWLAVGDVDAARREATVVAARSARLGASGLQRSAERLLATVGGPGPAAAPGAGPEPEPAAGPGPGHATGPPQAGRPGAVPRVRGG